ncbi:MAG: hypothetical protein PVG99_03275 [Desulfobacteraceae bacterium]
MKEDFLAEKILDQRLEPQKGFDQYHSAEFSVDGLDLAYQFRIWNVAPASMCVLVKEDSDLLSRLKVGDTLDVKYYSPRSSCPSNYQKTAISHITKNDQGRLKGHYLVGLEILEG